MACSPIQYNDLAFRKIYPNYGDITENPQWAWDTAILYISNQQGGAYCGGMTVAQQTQAISLMTAHLIYLQGLMANGNVPAMTVGAGIDKINVTLQPPPEVNQWQWWLNLTPYGQQLLAMLQVGAVGGFYVNAGAPGRAGFNFGGVC